MEGSFCAFVDMVVVYVHGFHTWVMCLLESLENLHDWSKIHESCADTFLVYSRLVHIRLQNYNKIVCIENIGKMSIFIQESAS